MNAPRLQCSCEVGPHGLKFSEHCPIAGHVCLALSYVGPRCKLCSIPIASKKEALETLREHATEVGATAKLLPSTAQGKVVVAAMLEAHAAALKEAAANIDGACCIEHLTHQ